MENKNLTNAEKALLMHEKWNGKLETTAKSKVNSREDLAIAYTPGVAEPCRVIAQDKEAAYTYTMNLRRQRCAWTWKYRRSRRTAGDGGQMRSV